MSDACTVEVHNLSKTYRDGLFRRKSFAALSDVTLSVQPGEVFGLLGPNGAGKTTFLKILLGIISKTGGQARMLGQPAGSRSARERVGYLPEHLRMPQHLTANSALELYGNLGNIPSSQVRARRGELLALVGLDGRENERIKKFSKGMLQRLGIAQALLNDPKLLILDEPTDGLDPRARADVRSLIMKLKQQGVTVFVNSHILQEIELICDRVAILNRGRLQFLGSVSQAAEQFRKASQDQKLKIDFVLGTADVSNLPFPVDVQIARTTPMPGDETELEVEVSSQEMVDQLVDLLRRNHISIISMERRKASLEEAFLAILDEPSTQT